MGTRNLTMVIANGKTKVAQYGQWDGYPSGQGTTILAFLHTLANMDEFKQKVTKCKFISGKELERRYKELGITGDFMNLEQAARFKAKYPQFDRDMAAEVLQEIYKGNVNELDNSESFAADSLFCEYAYVIDLDKNTFEIYEGFNKEPLSESERFYYLQAKNKHVAKHRGESQYYPVKHLKTYSLNSLPTEEAFLQELEPQETEEEA